MDVKYAFLIGFLKEEVYVEQPPDYIKRNQDDKVYCLQKALYELKQAPRTWNMRIDDYFSKEWICEESVRAFIIRARCTNKIEI